MICSGPQLVDKVCSQILSLMAAQECSFFDDDQVVTQDTRLISRRNLDLGTYMTATAFGKKDVPRLCK